jgi:hypothetical protein
MSALLVGLIVTYVVSLAAAIVLLPRDLLGHDLDQLRRARAALMRAVRRIPVPAPRMPRRAGAVPAEPPPEPPAAAAEPPAEEPPAKEPPAKEPAAEKPTNGAAVPAVAAGTNGATLPSRLPRRPVGGSPILHAAPESDAAEDAAEPVGGDATTAPPPPGQRSNASRLVGFTSGSRRRTTADSPKS